MIVIAVCVVCSIGIVFIIAARWKIHSMARGPHGTLPHMSQSTAPPNEVGRPGPPDILAIEPHQAQHNILDVMKNIQTIRVDADGYVLARCVP